ncbi:PIG-L family deacetylase [Mycobacterium crocinum]|uniref:PIG-L family deacetylase n=1 Tax=Mycolicibacterium crocinum TaxID=388459 RepID=A0ABY3TQ27_9MYCO|nr:PIG-L family deacetylase [Mycolicibacterium crocinum]MCV7215637.1 PIG-L family deacetylase [Mycolicibacterium crocinum]ULN43060.1 PIG-L family deacetylase [Mycolicibacterium crocinum]
MRELMAARVDEIAVVGAHCDDIAIGMGGTLLTLSADKPGLRVHALVLSGAGSEREDEERAALAAFCPGASVRVSVLDIPDGRTPAYWQDVKAALHEFRQSCEPAIVFGPQRHDAHQDHRLLAELLPTEFRDHLILGYEILKWETDTPQPNLFHPLPHGVAEKKAQLLGKHYPSQAMHDWFDDEAFLGLSRLRGVQCRSRHAEAFTAEKMSLRFGGR